MSDPKRPNPITALRKNSRETAYLLLAIAIAIAAQGFVGTREPSQVTTGIVLFVVAVLMTIRVSGSVASDDSKHAVVESRSDEPVTSNGLWNRIRAPDVAPVLSAAVGCSLLALFIFERVQGVVLNLAWVLYLVSLVLGLIVASRLDPQSSSPTRTWNRRDSIALILILAVAAFFRLWRLDQMPWGLWFDEASPGLDVIHILADPSYRPVFLDTIVPEPALHWYFDAIFFALLGPTVFALRISAVIAGLVAVAGVFLLGRKLYGWRTGVVAAGFLAVASWHVNFSRVMFNAIWSVAFDTLAAYFLAKAVQSGRFRHYAMSGFFIGLGLNNYYTTRLFVVAAGIFLLYRWVIDRRRLLRQSLAGILVLGAFMFVSGAPIIEFAVLHPSVVNSRIAQVSVFREMSDQNSLNPLISNVERHLEMFNYAGDPNGRHNLSGAPELDQVMAGLFVVGLALGVRRLRRPEFALPLIWLPVGLAGGIFSLSFEAPQSLRSLDNSVVSVLIASIPIGALWGRLNFARLGQFTFPRVGAWRPGKTTCSVGAILALSVFGWTASLNYHRYFDLQANDFRTWSEFAASPTEIGLEISALDLANTSVYLGAQFLGQPTIAFFAPNYHEVMFDRARDLPFRGSRNVAVFLPDTDEETALAIQRIYPKATIRAFGPPFGGATVMYSIFVSSAEIAALQGLTGEYFSGRDFSAKPAFVTKDANVDFNWTTTKSPLPAPFSVRWRGVLTAPAFGNYILKLQGPPDSQLFVDENPVSPGSADQGLILAVGTHTLSISATLVDLQPVHLLWQPPGAGRLGPVPQEDLFVSPAVSRGLLGQYYSGADWGGSPALEQIDSALSMTFHIIPLPRPYSVVWQGKVDIPTNGVYAFGTRSVDSSWIYLDNRLVATNQGQPNEYSQGAIRLDAGMHDIRIQFQDLTGFSYISIFWQPPDLEREVLPPDRLFPPQGAYPDRAGPLKPSILKSTPSYPANTQVVARGPAVAAPAPTSQSGTTALAPSLPAPGPLPPGSLRLSQTIGEGGSGPGQMKSPRGVVIDLQGNVYVVDTDNSRIDKFDSAGKYLLSWGSKGDGDDQFQEPVDAVLDSTGQIIVLESGSGWLKVFTPEGKFVARFGGPTLSVYHPRGLAISPSGDLFVADAGGGRLLRLRATGELAESIGLKDKGPGQTAEPVDVAWAADGGLFVADTALSRLTHFDASNHVIQTWGLPKASSATGPRILTLADHSIYVSDPENGRLIHFDASGSPIDQIGSPSELKRPMGMASDAKGDIFVCDAEGNRVIEYSPHP